MMLAHVAKHTNREKYNCGHCGKPSNWQSVIRVTDRGASRTVT